MSQSGHNLPRPALGLDAESWRLWLDAQFSDAIRRAEELLAAFRRAKESYPLGKPAAGQPPVGIERWDDDVQGRVGDLRDKFRSVLDNAKRLHDAEKAPVLVAQRAIDGYLTTFRAPLDAAVAIMVDWQTTYGEWQEHRAREAAKAEAARLQEEADKAAEAAAYTLDPEKLQAAADTAAAASDAAEYANAPPAELSRVHGEISVTSLRRRWVFVPEESDLAALVKAVHLGQAPAEYLTFNDSVIRQAIGRGLRKCPGLAITEQKRAA